MIWVSHTCTHWRLHCTQMALRWIVITSLMGYEQLSWFFTMNRVRMHLLLF
ncbi:hypothetical protein D3C81_2227030 [compost metagenome]